MTQRAIAPASRLARILFGSLVAIGATGCTPGPSASIPGASPSATRSPASSPSGSPTISAGAPTDVPVQPELLAILPSQVGGLDLQPAPDIAADLASDPNLVSSIEGIAAAIAVDPQTGEFAYVTVTAQRAGIFDAAFFRGWRESFDIGACNQAGGVERTAETAIAGRTVHIGTCAEGLRTYHVHLEGPDRIVSISSLGEKRLGEQIVGSLGS